MFIFVFNYNDFVQSVRVVRMPFTLEVKKKKKNI